jgi:hypothetical protein
MTKHPKAPFARASAKLGLALASILLASLLIGPSAPSGGTIAAAVPHVGDSCDEPGGDFTDGSAVVGMAVTPDDGGYWIVNNAGQIAACGDAAYYGQPATLNKPVVGIAATPDGGGYYEVASDGGIFAYGDAHFQGSTGNIALNKPVVGMAVDPATGGYWLVATDGGIFAYNAPFLGSTGSITLNKPVVGMAAATNGMGYWFVASDGGIFAYGVPFYGSTGSIALNKPVVGMAVDAATGGYWMVASDGGIFAFNAPFLGSTGSIVLNKPIVGMEASPAGTGYRFVAADGGIFAYGSQFYGTPTFASPTTPVPPPSTTGIEASFSCSGTAPPYDGEGKGFTVSFWTKARPGLVETGVPNFGFVTLPWSATLDLSPTDGYVVLGGLFWPDGVPPGAFVTCSTTVTWPGGSVTQTASSADGNPFYAQICSDYPNDSGWVGCPSGSDN